jgi:mannose-1-phosphate guanylyltransferase
MKALLLAGGIGTRLKPLTNFLPKCLAPINGRPLIDYWISALVDNNITEIVLNTHYLSNLVQEYIEKSTWKNFIHISHEPSLLGTGGTIINNKSFFQTDDFLVAHADNMFNFNLKELFISHEKKNKQAIATMLTFYTNEPQNCGVISMDEDFIINKFDEKNPSLSGRSLANAAIYIFSKDVFDYFDEKKNFIDLSLDIIPKLVGKINGCIHQGNIIDIGTFSAWNRANLDIQISEQKFLEKNQKSWESILRSFETNSNE